MDLSGGHQTCFPWADYQPALEIPRENIAPTPPATPGVAFRDHYISRGPARVRVHYSLDNRTDGRRCVTIYDRDYGHALRQVLPDEYRNDTDIYTDYHEHGRVVIFEAHPLYLAARTRAESVLARKHARWQARRATR